MILSTASGILSPWTPWLRSSNLHLAGSAKFQTSRIGKAVESALEFAREFVLEFGLQRAIDAVRFAPFHGKVYGPGKHDKFTVVVDVQACPAAASRKRIVLRSSWRCVLSQFPRAASVFSGVSGMTTTGNRASQFFG